MGKSQTPIESLGLGSRAEKALRQLGVVTIGKLLRFDASKVLGLPGCGHGVYQRLVSTQKRLHVERSSSFSPARQAASAFQVLRLSTGSWAQRCLAELGVRNLHDLAAVRFVDFMNLRGFGLNTWAEIAAVRRQALEILGGIVVENRRRTVKNPATLLRQPPARQTLLAMPLFSGLESHFFGSPEFHRAWRANWRIADLALSVRAFTLCHRSGVKTLGQLLLFPGTTFLAERNSHYGTLRKVHNAVQTLLLDGLSAQQARIDYRSFDQMLSSWLAIVLNEFFAQIVSRRFQVIDGRFVTYERISEEFHITRARVGQIWETARLELRRRQNLVILTRFWSAVRQELRSGARRLEPLAEALAKALAWRETPPELAVRELVSLNPELSLVKRGTLVRLKSA